MRVRITRTLVIGLLAALVLTSCGGDDDEDALSEAELVRRGNEICNTHAKHIEDEAKSRFGTSRNVPSVQETEDFANRVVVPAMDRMVDELEDLKAPDDEKDDFREYLRETEKSLDDDVKQDPVSILSEQASSDAFAEANEKATDVGLNECARVSERIRTAAAARAPR